MQPMKRHRMDNNTYIRPRPTKLSGGVMIGVGAVFLLFSLVPLLAAEGEARPFAIGFAAVWILMCLSFIVYGVYILTSAKPSSGIIFDIEDNTVPNDPAPPGDFETRIRKLEKLKDDRLITEEEYKSKRAEIMKEQW
jgi:hypothetical protein